jgi:hypothetical protein
MWSSTVSWPLVVIEIVLPAAKGPETSIHSMSAFHSPQVATSDQRRQIDQGEAVVSMLCSVLPIRARGDRREAITQVVSN